MFVRDCPDCGEEMSYSKKGNLDRAIKKGAVCKSCSKIGKKRPTFSDEHRSKISIGMGGNGKLDRKYPRHVAWANRVKERDGCCQKCQSIEDLHAHHLIPRALMPQYYDVDANGITLCKSCHIELHKILRQN